MGDLSSSPPARIEASTAGKERGENDRRATKSPKPVPVLRKEPEPPELDVSNEERHQLDERA